MSIDPTTKAEIQARAEGSRDRFRAYLATLIGAPNPQATGIDNTLTSAERDLFNVTGASQFAVSGQVVDLMQRINKITDQRISDMIDNGELVKYNSTNTIGLQALPTDPNLVDVIGDLDGNAQLSTEDRDAANYLFNFDDSLTGLINQVMEISQDPDLVTQFRISRFADQRGLGDLERQNFITQFEKFAFDANYGADTALLQRLVNVYDKGVTDMSILEDYYPLIASKQSITLTGALYQFEQGPDFRILSDAEQKTVRQNLVTILSDPLKEQSKLVASAITSRKMPFTGENTTVGRLVDFILETNDDPAAGLSSDQKIDLLRVKDLGEGIGLFGAKLEEFRNYFNPILFDDERSFQEISRLSTVYRELLSKSPNTPINDLDIYSQGLQNGMSMNNVRDLVKLEMTTEFKIYANNNGREETLGELMSILNTKSSPLNKMVENAIRKKYIPLSDEPFSVRGLMNFITDIKYDANGLERAEEAQSSEIADETFRGWARERGEDPERFVQEFGIIYNNFDPSNGISKTQRLLKLYDLGQTDFNNLLKFSDAFENGVRPEYGYALQAYMDNPLQFGIVDTVTKNEDLDKYLAILKGEDPVETANKKQLLERALKTGSVPFLNTDLNRRDLNDLLFTQLANEGDFDRLNLEQIAGESGNRVGSTEYTNYLTGITDFFTNQGFSMGSIRNVTTLYRQANGRRTLNQLAPYAEAMTNKLPFGVARDLFNYETGPKFNITNRAQRDDAVDRYLNILQGNTPNPDTADAQKNILLGAMRYDELRYTKQVSTATNLNKLLDDIEDIDGLFNKQIEEWLDSSGIPKGSSKYNQLETTVRELRNDYGYTDADINSAIRVLRKVPSIGLNEVPLGNTDVSAFELYGDAIGRGVKAKEALTVAEFINDPQVSFSLGNNELLKTQKTQEYLAILTDGTPDQKSLMLKAMQDREIFVLDKVANIQNIDELLTAAADETTLVRANFEKNARSLYPNRPGDRIQYMARYYDDLYEQRQLDPASISTIATLEGEYDFSDAEFDKIVDLVGGGAKTKLLRNYARYTRESNLSEPSRLNFLDILQGNQGADKQRILNATLLTGSVPIAGIKVFD